MKSTLNLVVTCLLPMLGVSQAQPPRNRHWATYIHSPGQMDCFDPQKSRYFAPETFDIKEFCNGIDKDEKGVSRGVSRFAYLQTDQTQTEFAEWYSSTAERALLVNPDDTNWMPAWNEAKPRPNGSTVCRAEAKLCPVGLKDCPVETKVCPTKGNQLYLCFLFDTGVWENPFYGNLCSGGDSSQSVEESQSDDEDTFTVTPIGDDD